jgi:hypothetical protein
MLCNVSVGFGRDVAVVVAGTDVVAIDLGFRFGVPPSM